MFFVFIGADIGSEQLYLIPGAVVLALERGAGPYVCEGSLVTAILSVALFVRVDIQPCNLSAGRALRLNSAEARMDHREQYK